MNVHPRLIGLGGLKRSGKDTLADHWRDTADYAVLGMSDALLEMAVVLNPHIEFDHPRQTLLGGVRTSAPLAAIVENEGYTKAKEYTEVREFLKRLGTDVGREMIDQDLWVKQAESRIRKHWAEGRHVVITGIRFPNELDLIISLGGILLRVERPSVVEGDMHASEISVSSADFDEIVLNDGSLEDLYRRGDEILVRRAAQSVLDANGFITARDEDPLTVWFESKETFSPSTDFDVKVFNEMLKITAEQNLPSMINPVPIQETRESLTPSEEVDSIVQRHGKPVAVQGSKIVFSDRYYYSAGFGTSKHRVEVLELLKKRVYTPADDVIEFIDRNTDGTERKQPLSSHQRDLIAHWKKEGREFTIDDSGISLTGSWTEDKQFEHARLIGLATQHGWHATVEPDGSVTARHPVDYPRADIPGYVSLTKDPHQAVECLLCGARYVNHIQHTKWHDSIESE